MQLDKKNTCQWTSCNIKFDIRMSILIIVLFNKENLQQLQNGSINMNNESNAKNVCMNVYNYVRSCIVQRVRYATVWNYIYMIMDCHIITRICSCMVPYKSVRECI